MLEQNYTRGPCNLVPQAPVFLALLSDAPGSFKPKSTRSFPGALTVDTLLACHLAQLITE